MIPDEGASTAVRQLPGLDEREAVAFLQALVRLNTANPPGHESLAADLIQAHLAPFGFRFERLAAEPGRDCLIATLEGTEGHPTLIFNGHTDVVPVSAGWTRDPFGGEVEGGELYGNGVEDMKAGVAAFVLAAQAFARDRRKLRGTLVLHAVADETAGGAKGTGHLYAENKLKGDFAVVCEPTGLDVFIAHRGLMYFELVIEGLAAHSGRPWMGVNAIAKASDVMQELTRVLGPIFATRPHQMLPGPSINFARIEGGARESIVAGRCRLDFDRRMLPGEGFDEAEAEIRQVVEQVRSRDRERWTFSLRRKLAVPGLEVDRGERIVRECQRAYQQVTGDESRIGCTSGLEDAHWYARAGIRPAMFGPYVRKRWEGENRFDWNVSRPNEHLAIPQWLSAIRVYMQLTHNILG